MYLIYNPHVHLLTISSCVNIIRQRLLEILFHAAKTSGPKYDDDNTIVSQKKSWGRTNSQQWDHLLFLDKGKCVSYLQKAGTGTKRCDTTHATAYDLEVCFWQSDDNDETGSERSADLFVWLCCRFQPQ